MTKKYLNELTYKILGAAIEVHKVIGPGLLESVYHKCMKIELKKRDISFEDEHRANIHYKGSNIDGEIRCDLLVEKTIIVELKSVDQINSIHEAQLMSYMKLLNSPKGMIINFNCMNIFKEGQKTRVNELFRYLTDE